MFYSSYGFWDCSQKGAMTVSGGQFAISEQKKKEMKTVKTSACKSIIMLNPSCQGGFSLIEILIAIFIFGVVITTVLMSHNILEGSSRAISSDLSDYEMVRICLDRMTADLRNLYVTPSAGYRPPEVNNRPDFFRVSGSQEYCKGIPVSRLEFASLSHLPTGRKKTAGIARIAYYPAEGEKGTCLLKRSDRSYLAGDVGESGNDPILCEKLKRLEIRYVDSNGQEHESWDSDSDDYDYLTPRAVKIVMVIGDEDDSRLFKTMIRLKAFRDDAGKGQ